MSEIRLPGLLASSPLGFVAALGLLRVLGEDRQAPVGLRWDGDVAVLVGIGFDDLMVHLREHLRGRTKAPEFNLVVDGQPIEHLRDLTPRQFQALAARFAEDRRALQFLAGYGTDAAVREGSCIVRTQFDMTGGQQRFMQVARAAGLLLDESQARAGKAAPVADRLRVALLGGPPESGVHSMGWEPSSISEHARSAEAPSFVEPRGHAARIWLAVEALACHPVLLTSPGRARTAGFAEDGAYWWPVWSDPVHIVEAQRLRLRPPATLVEALGVTGVWRAERRSVGKYGYFRPAARTTGDGRRR